MLVMTQCILDRSSCLPPETSHGARVTDLLVASAFSHVKNSLSLSLSHTHTHTACLSFLLFITWFSVSLPLCNVVTFLLIEFSSLPYQLPHSQARHCLGAHYKAAKTFGCGLKSHIEVSSYTSKCRITSPALPLFLCVWMEQESMEGDDVCMRVFLRAAQSEQLFGRKCFSCYRCVCVCVWMQPNLLHGVSSLPSWTHLRLWSGGSHSFSCSPPSLLLLM